MMVQRDYDAGAFLKASDELLYQREAENGLIIGLVENLLPSSALPPANTIEPLLLRVVDEGRTQAVMIQTRKESCATSHLYSAAQVEALSKYLFDNNLTPEGINGPHAQLLAVSLAKRTSRRLKPLMGLRILAAENVTSPRPAPGTAVTAVMADADTVFGFLKAFHDESVPHDPWDPVRMRNMIEQKIEREYISLWKHEHETVATAHLGRSSRHGIAISAVFTPPAKRGRGYASNLIAHLTREQLRTGREFCVLYTDKTNPTSNKIYESIGYHVVGESDFVQLTPG